MFEFALVAKSTLSGLLLVSKGLWVPTRTRVHIYHAHLEKMSIVAQTLGVLRENHEGVEITLFCCMVVSHARELISFFAQFEHFHLVFLCLSFCNFLLHKLLITRVSCSFKKDMMITLLCRVS